MTFLIVLICCVWELLYPSPVSIRGDRWIKDLHGWLLGLAPDSGVGPMAATLAAVLVPTVAVGLAFVWLNEQSQFVAGLAAIALILASMGPAELGRDIEAYLQSFLDDDRVRMGSESANFLIAMERSPDDPDRPLLRAMVFEAHTRIFAPLFWFAVLGPAGVVLFRIAASLRTTVQPNERVGQVLMRLFEILAWLPARLLLLGCGLAGTLAPTVHAWRELDDFSLAATWRALGDGSLSALGYGNLQDITTDDPHVYWINSMYGLIQRAFTVWLVLFAFLTLGVLAA